MNDITKIIDSISTYGFSATFCGTEAVPAWEIRHGYTGRYPSREAVTVHEEICAIAKRAGL